MKCNTLIVISRLQESLTFRLDNLQVKVDLLEEKNAEQAEEILKLKAKECRPAPVAFNDKGDLPL